MPKQTTFDDVIVIQTAPKTFRICAFPRKVNGVLVWTMPAKNSRHYGPFGSEKSAVDAAKDWALAISDVKEEE